MSLAACLEVVAPYYNLALVSIVVVLFIYLFSHNLKGHFVLPWKVLFVIIIIYIVEQILTILVIAELIIIPRITNAFFELVIATLMIYLLLLQLEHKKNE